MILAMVSCLCMTSNLSFFVYDTGDTKYFLTYLMILGNGEIFVFDQFVITIFKMTTLKKFYSEAYYSN